MIYGSRMVEKDMAETLDRLKLMMAAGNFEITDEAADSLSFKHGSMFASGASHFPKRGIVRLALAGGSTEVSYEVEPVGIMKYHMMLFGTLMFWMVFPAIIARKVLVDYPMRLMDNLLAGL